MVKIISECPSCGGRLKIAALSCASCGMELRNEFQLSPFEQLKEEQMGFLICFLKHRGNMRAVQSELEISYPTAKKKLDDVLIAMGLADEAAQIEENEEVVDMPDWNIGKESTKASDIIKRKLMKNNGRAIVYTARGLPCEVRVASDGVSFLCDKLPISKPYEYEVFDVIVELLRSQRGRARKGNGRNNKLGEPDCDETTVVGAVGYYRQGKTGKAVYDPVFVLAAILEWADIAKNERGELVLTAEYQAMLRATDEQG